MAEFRTPMNPPHLTPRLLLSQRWELLRQAKQNPSLQGLLMEQCRRDIRFWFRHFCWTFDPRQTDCPHRPFVPYPFQEALLLQVKDAIDHGHDLLVEKSRDMGVSWLILLIFQHYWLFQEGAHFHLGSRKEDYVDRKGDVSTLFEKLRYNLSHLPGWMKPEGFDANRHDLVCRLVNPTNGNTITGESSNEHFARGGRYRGILMDEFPVWPKADAAYAAAGQSSPCRLVVGTPYGKNNRFADLRFNSPIAVATVHWQNHPHKDAHWYQAQQQRMTEDEVARELDIHYSRSLRDRVFTEFNPVQHVADLQALPNRRMIRSWDFGFHCPACVLIQLDAHDRVQVLLEVVGNRERLVPFAQRVLALCAERFPGAMFEDVCDPAGTQQSDKSDHTSIELLNSLEVYPFYQRSRLLHGIELIRLKLAENIDGVAGLRVDRRCAKLIEALEGGYRYGPNQSELPLEEHPYEDMVDCLRYAVAYKCQIPSRKPLTKPRTYQPVNRYTGY
ncbi:MAG: hypothetical protein SFZ03_00385 [Candidatus Melainabacteria bacterium]|nr:hypothetical protein [Candidatus Melainabacteria bacterium]